MSDLDVNKEVKILLAGGGSGGHLTPLLAVARSIKEKNPESTISYVGQRKEGLQDVMDHEAINDVHAIFAGKFRRYHGESLLSHILDVKTLFFNLRDLFYLGVGSAQAWRLLGKIRPDAVFLKGGFVCVPVGYAARFRRIPYITHDSDAIPGLANRLTAKHAVYNTTAMPAQYYPYQPQKVMQVGIPLQPEFARVSLQDTVDAKKALGIAADAQVICSVGGGLGAQLLNKALVEAARQLLPDDPTIVLIHLTGKKLYEETQQLYAEALDQASLERVRLVDFSTELYKLSAAADVVVTRAGATNVAEFATQGKACIIMPNPVLTGGQQLKNAQVIDEMNAALIVEEGSAPQLLAALRELLGDKAKRTALGDSIHALATTNAADKLADILIKLNKT